MTVFISEEAVMASQAAICVAQFIKQPNHEEKLKGLGKLSNWDRGKFIEKGGWDKMPGQANAKNRKKGSALFRLLGRI